MPAAQARTVAAGGPGAPSPPISRSPAACPSEGVWRTPETLGAVHPGAVARCSTPPRPKLRRGQSARGLGVPRAVQGPIPGAGESVQTGRKRTSPGCPVHLNYGYLRRICYDNASQLSEYRIAHGRSTRPASAQRDASRSAASHRPQAARADPGAGRRRAGVEPEPGSYLESHPDELSVKQLATWCAVVCLELGLSERQAWSQDVNSLASPDAPAATPEW